MNGLRIVRVVAPDDDVRALIGELDATLAAHYAAEQRHGLGIDALFSPAVRFFVAYRDDAAQGCGGVALFDEFAEVKRMYARPAARGTGIAPALLARIEAEARDADCPVLRLETGTQQLAAIRLYERAGFTPRAAFGEYARMQPEAIASSLFFEKQLR